MKKISKYQIFFELQHGPITRVYKAFQLELQRPVLVKQLNPDRIADEELVERFRQEGLILAQINSPHVITVFDFGFEDGVPFLVTEFIEGSTLAELIQRCGGLPWDIGLYITEQLAHGLMAIHHQNIVHRDIKPDNIFISNEGDVKLGDLGFSAPLQSVEESIQGTPAYLAPEIVIGEPVDFRSDIYSLGLVAYEMLTGQNPFAGESMGVILNRIVNLKPMTIHKVKPDVPDDLSQLIAKMMARQPEERFQTTHDLIQSIEQWRNDKGIHIAQECLIRFIENPEQYRPASNSPKQSLPLSPPKPKHYRLPALAIATIIVMAVLFLIAKNWNKAHHLSPAASDTTRVAQSEMQKMPKQADSISVALDHQKKGTERPQKNFGEGETTPAGEIRSADTNKSVWKNEFSADTVIITTDPRAFIYRQGVSLGIAPLKIAVDRRDEKLELEFRSPGFPAIHKIVNITPPDVQNIHINLWKEVGYFEIDIIPWGVIWIDGDSVDVTPLNRPIILAPGNHKLMVRHPTLKGITEPFYIAMGETLKKSIQLHRLP